MILPVSLVSMMEPTLPKAAQVYEVIRRAIIGLTMPPGSAINEKAICEQLGISRTPLREAILRLSAENLVAIVPNSGTYVSKIDLQSVFDGQLVRDALEMKVVRLAATRMSSAFLRNIEINMYHQERLAAEIDYDGFYELDEAFHSMICEQGASLRVWKIINGAKAQLDRVRRLAFPHNKHLDVILTEHAAIVDGLRLRDPEAAAAAMKVHLDRVFETIRTLMIERKDYFATTALEGVEGYPFEIRNGIPAPSPVGIKMPR
ncbi:MAG: GntR family transcriptional regulator [Ancalomicrobiaceae bacterium]|nr:GntR family transcriptional regulator [Ancalomicrobiaceae bacterium]